MYDKYSMKAEEFIDDGEIRASIAWAEENKTNLELVNQLIDKTDELKGLSHREALLLYYYHGLTLEQTAGALGIRPASACTRLKRARARLKHLLEGDDPDED